MVQRGVTTSQARRWPTNDGRTTRIKGDQECGYAPPIFGAPCSLGMRETTSSPVHSPRHVSESTRLRTLSTVRAWRQLLGVPKNRHERRPRISQRRAKFARVQLMSSLNDRVSRAVNAQTKLFKHPTGCKVIPYLTIFAVSTDTPCIRNYPYLKKRTKK